MDTSSETSNPEFELKINFQLNKPSLEDLRDIKNFEWSNGLQTFSCYSKMKISYSDLKSLYSRLSAIDINSILTNTRNVSLADIKDYSSKVSNKILNQDFIFFSKYSPFLALSLYAIIVIPITFSTYRSLTEKQRLNKQYELERDQIEILTSTLISIESEKSALQEKQKSINLLLLSPGQVDQIPFAIDDLSKLHNIIIDEFNFLSINDFNAACRVTRYFLS